MRELIQDFFTRLNIAVERARESDEAVEEVEAMLAKWMVIAGPDGVSGAYNGGPYKKVLATLLRDPKAATIRTETQVLDITPIDSRHCLAHADEIVWNEKDEVLSAKRKHYLMQIINGKVQTFGWIAGDPDDDVASGVCAA